MRRGLGLALVQHGAGFTGSGEVKLASRAVLDLSADGWPCVKVANTEIGQGAITMFAQIVAQVLGLPAARVVIHVPDTASVPDSGPTVASRTLMVVGGLLERCARRMKEKLELFAERALAGEDDFHAVALRWRRERGELRSSSSTRSPRRSSGTTTPTAATPTAASRTPRWPSRSRWTSTPARRRS